VKVEKRIKHATECRIRRYRELLDRIARTNDTGLDDELVAKILEAESGPWTTFRSVDEMMEWIDAQETAQ
jgi:hypothetical protein